MSTLSVETSSSASSASTESPTFLSQRLTVPSVTLSPRAGRVTSVPPPSEPGALGVGEASAAFGSSVSDVGSGCSGSDSGSASPARLVPVARLLFCCRLGLCLRAAAVVRAATAFALVSDNPEYRADFDRLVLLGVNLQQDARSR